MPFTSSILEAIFEAKKTGVLNLSNRNPKLNDDDIIELATVLENTPAIRSLDVRNNDIGTRGATILASNKTLHTLYLYNGNNSLNFEDLRPFLQNTTLKKFPIVGGSGELLTNLRKHFSSNKQCISILPPPVVMPVSWTFPVFHIQSSPQVQVQPKPVLKPSIVIDNPVKLETPGIVLPRQEFLQNTRVVNPYIPLPLHQPLPKVGKTAIQISYRDEGNGGSAFYDHYTIQRATGYETQIAISPHMQTTALAGHVRAGTNRALDFGITQDGKKMPKVFDNVNEVGLLVIPGRARETEKKRLAIHLERTMYEQEILRDARRTGRPVLAICAGSWQLWESYGGTIEPVKNHNYGAGMPRIGTNGNIVRNVQVHDILIRPGSLLSRIILNPNIPARLSVNSVHWMAPNILSKPTMLTVSATAINHDDITRHNRQGEIMQSDEDTVEAFETEFGAPVIGVQYHPEAYNKNDAADLNPQKHHSLLLYMAKAGDAYNQKQKMLKEFREKHHPIELGLRPNNEMKVSEELKKRIALLQKKQTTLPAHQALGGVRQAVIFSVQKAKMSSIKNVPLNNPQIKPTPRPQLPNFMNATSA